MEETIITLITEYVKSYPQKYHTETSWEEPLVGFVSVDNPIIRNLKNIIIETHQMPEDILENPKTIISYFIPYQEEIAKSNITVEDNYASQEWATAYYETNEMMDRLNEYLTIELKKLGYRSAASTSAKTISREILFSNWSHRHIAYCAGLGTFGINNMLITEKGCCGRFNSIVTDVVIESKEIINDEYCLYKRDGSCGICVDKCFTDALDYTGFVREICSEMCKRNEMKYGPHHDVCGKCVVGLPCTFKRP